MSSQDPRTASVPNHIDRTEWWQDLCHGVFGPRNGGARIIIDAQNAATGVGKTSLAVSLAQLLSRVFGYQLKEEDMTLSAAEYLKRWKEHPDKEQPSVLILDELSGGGAADTRRAMSHSNVKLGRSWELMRKKRVVTITTLPHWSDADSKMRRLADYRLWCLEKPIGYFKPYKIGAAFDNGNVTPRGYDDVERIRFPNMDGHGDHLYEYLASLKDDLLDSQSFDADDLVEEDGEDGAETPEDAVRREQIKTAFRLVQPWDDDNGLTYREAAKSIPFTYQWISDRVSEYRDGKHADIADEAKEEIA